MSRRTPPSLEHLAMQNLLSHPALANSALDDLPMLLFPSLFMEAYIGGHKEVLKAMVQAWPFPCLPLGDLAQPPDLEIIKAVLDGLDLLLSNKERRNRWKLQVVDLLGEHPGIWTLGYPAMAQISYPGFPPGELRASPWTGMGEEQPLMIAMDLTIAHSPKDDLQAFLLQWAWERRERVRLCPRVLEILSDSSSETQKALQVVNPDSILELLVSKLCLGETEKTFAFLLSQMKKLRILSFCNMCAHLDTSSSPNFSCSSFQLGAHLGQLQHLQEVRMKEIVFLGGKLPAIFRSLPPLKDLFLSSCNLQEADLRFLSRCPCTRQLKHLWLRNLSMKSFSPELLRALLEQVASTLEILALEKCEITDAQVSAILPALSQCSKLSSFSFYGNHVFMDTLQSLLALMARLGHLNESIYSPPVESYVATGNLDPDRFFQVLAGLAQDLRDVVTTPNKIQICPGFCHLCNYFLYYFLGPDGSWVLRDEEFHNHEALAG
ncbi:PRAME family member 8-like [Perognathus longimembris pacificus]|uniref:PRAME family member 8-like n=1 Tax=Perognathus longimembris pacificus TaxID=214514 RepID=UPI0020186CAA|nr:PRAME family member 8-like [Perognathus longimembris pacificus]